MITPESDDADAAVKALLKNRREADAAFDAMFEDAPFSTRDMIDFYGADELLKPDPEL